ncbi:hypothetical protein [Aporhodopirellula aestuarii]|uniref:Uncharacterized protein n=1 Tax=Aporhodopirellula aestuarii TaxID=2950107 RepID=A0ABT0U5E6_9BACT|nr:hypothetical protein [Aporhodopirellula aestuarii]MCM2372140.1 hypothetical protein [Aporhodopirellula aestuarii]
MRCTATLVLPYLLLGGVLYAATFLALVPHSPTNALHDVVLHDFSRYARNLNAVALGFPLLGMVLVHWVPQTAAQRMTGIAVGAILLFSQCFAGSSGFHLISAGQIIATLGYACISIYAAIASRFVLKLGIQLDAETTVEANSVKLGFWEYVTAVCFVVAMAILLVWMAAFSAGDYSSPSLFRVLGPILTILGILFACHAFALSQHQRMPTRMLLLSAGLFVLLIANVTIAPGFLGRLSYPYFIGKAFGPLPIQVFTLLSFFGLLRRNSFSYHRLITQPPIAIPQKDSAMKPRGSTNPYEPTSSSLTD